MSSKKVFLLGLVASSFLSATAVFADDSGPTAAELDRAYQHICVPGSEKGLSEEEMKKALDMRMGFHRFLRNPEELVGAYEEAKKEGGLGGFGTMIMVAASCGANELLNSRIETLGCKDESGKAVSNKKATELCAPVLKEMKEEEEKNE